MAIVEMKHVDMLALESDRQSLLEAIQKLGCVQLLPADSEDATFNKALPTVELPALEETISRVGWAIHRLSKYDTTKKRLMADKPVLDAKQAYTVLDAQPRLMETVEKLEALERDMGDLRGQAARLDATAEQLTPWKDLPVPPSEIASTHNTYAALGTLQKTMLDQWMADGSLGELCTIEQVSTQRDVAYVYVLCHSSERERILALLKTANFSASALPQSNASVQEQLAENRAEREKVDQQQAALVQQTADQVGDLEALKQLYDLLASKRARLKAAEHFSSSERTFFMQGWIPAPMIDTFEKRILAVSPTVALSFSEAQEGEEPPVLLHNNPMASPFESVVQGFSLPSPRGIDPTAIMTPFYVNFMGMMISDAGYGLMMAIIIPILIKVLKPAKNTRNMLWLLAAGGVATLFWGALYNSWFGFAPLPTLFDPMNNALPVMGVCIGLGAVHLFTGLGIAAYMNIKRGKPLDAVADQLSWFLLVVGLALMIVKPQIGQWIAIAGAGIILVTAGREKSKNPLKRLLSGLGALYGATSWISDLLSYMRLFGMGLATGVIGMVINILVGMVFQSGPIGMVLGAILFVGGHLFNAGINTLGAYVHSCRLQYIEFFGKFYEDGGTAFMPLSENNRYVYIRDV